MAEEVSLSCLRPFIFTFSLEKGERGFSFMERSNILAVILFRMNWMLTWMRPRSFFFFDGLDCKVYQLKWKRRKLSIFNGDIYIHILYTYIYPVYIYFLKTTTIKGRGFISFDYLFKQNLRIWYKANLIILIQNVDSNSEDQILWFWSNLSFETNNFFVKQNRRNGMFLNRRISGFLLGSYSFNLAAFPTGSNGICAFKIKWHLHKSALCSELQRQASGTLNRRVTGHFMHANQSHPLCYEDCEKDNSV